MLRIFARFWAKLRYRFNLEAKAATNELNAGLSALRGIHRPVGVDDFLRKGRLRRFAELGKQAMTQKAHVRTAPTERFQQVGQKPGH